MEVPLADVWVGERSGGVEADCSLPGRLRYLIRTDSLGRYSQRLCILCILCFPPFDCWIVVEILVGAGGEQMVLW